MRWKKKGKQSDPADVWYCDSGSVFVELTFQLREGIAASGGGRMEWFQFLSVEGGSIRDSPSGHPVTSPFLLVSEDFDSLQAMCFLHHFHLSALQFQAPISPPILLGLNLDSKGNVLYFLLKYIARPFSVPFTTHCNIYSRVLAAEVHPPWTTATSWVARHIPQFIVPLSLSWFYFCSMITTALFIL